MISNLKLFGGFVLSIMILISSTLWAVPGCAALDKEKRARLLVINHINLIPMNEEIVLNDKTVVIRDGKIINIQDDPIDDPLPETIIIDGKNRYLIPGLVDLHVHINNPKDLELFVANGVTTVQNMWGYQGFINVLGFSNQLKFKKRITAGKLLGPNIITAGPVLEGLPKNHPFMMEVTDAQKAKKIVAEQLRQGYDFIKVYDNLSQEVYRTVINQSQTLEIPVKGHVPFSAGLEAVIRSGQRQIDHLTGFLDYDSVKLLVAEDELDRYAVLAKKHEVYTCPTIVFTQKRVGMAQYDEMAKHPAMKHLKFMQHFMLRQSVKALEKDLKYQGKNYQKDVFDIYQRVIVSLKQAGAPILAGTDTGNPFVFPGYAIHEELELLVKTGLSPFEALQSATVNPYKSLNKLSECGTIEIGKRADLVILQKNPLENISNTKEIESVIIGGKYLSREELDRIL